MEYWLTHSVVIALTWVKASYQLGKVGGFLKELSTGLLHQILKTINTSILAFA